MPVDHHQIKDTGGAFRLVTFPESVLDALALSLSLSLAGAPVWPVSRAFQSLTRKIPIAGFSSYWRNACSSKLQYPNYSILTTVVPIRKFLISLLSGQFHWSNFTLLECAEICSEKLCS